MKTTKQRYCCILAFCASACSGSSFSDFHDVPDGSGTGGRVSVSAGGRSSTGGTTTEKAGSGGRGTGGLEDPDAGSSSGGRAAGGSLGSGGACEPQACANDGHTCGTVQDGCGHMAACLHECSPAELCLNATHECTCIADRVCPVLFGDRTQCVNPCCAADGSCGCGVGLGTTSCIPAGKCTWTEQGSPKGLCDTSLFVWQCPGRGPPDASCQLGTAQTGNPYYCCGKLSYP